MIPFFKRRSMPWNGTPYRFGWLLNSKSLKPGLTRIFSSWTCSRILHEDPLQPLSHPSDFGNRPLIIIIRNPTELKAGTKKEWWPYKTTFMQFCGGLIIKSNKLCDSISLLDGKADVPQHFTWSKAASDHSFCAPSADFPDMDIYDCLWSFQFMLPHRMTCLTVPFTLKKQLWQSSELQWSTLTTEHWCVPTLSPSDKMIIGAPFTMKSFQIALFLMHCASWWSRARNFVTVFVALDTCFSGLQLYLTSLLTSHFTSYIWVHCPLLSLHMSIVFHPLAS